MFTITVRQCSKIIDMLYNASVVKCEEKLRINFLKNLKFLVDYDSASFYLAENNSFSLAHPVYVNCDPHYAKLYNEKFLTSDLSIQYICSEDQLVYRSTDLIKERHYSSDFYKCFMKPQNLEYSGGMNLVWKKQFLGCVALFRKTEKPNFSEKELYILALFQDHLSHDLYNLTDSLLNISNIKTMKKKYLIDNYGLTHREIEIIELLLRGKTNAQIGKTLYIQLYTVKTHLKHIYKKLGIQNRSQILSLFIDSQ